MESELYEELEGTKSGANINSVDLKKDSESALRDQNELMNEFINLINN